MIIDNPQGIDLPIVEMQNLFSNNLFVGLNNMFYGRVFRNVDRNNNIIPEVYVGNGEYDEVSFDDRLDSMCWFDVPNATNSYSAGHVSQDIGVFFAVNLNKTFPDINHRAVEEAHVSVQNILLQRPLTFKITNLVTNTDAFGDFYTGNLKRFNMQPWHVFKFECNVKYQLNC